MSDKSGPDLTDAEKTAAERAGMTEERYAAMKGVRNLKDWEKLQAEEKGGE